MGSPILVFFFLALPSSDKSLELLGKLVPRGKISTTNDTQSGLPLHLNHCFPAADPILQCLKLPSNRALDDSEANRAYSLDTTPIDTLAFVQFLFLVFSSAFFFFLSNPADPEEPPAYGFRHQRFFGTKLGVE